MTKREFRQWLPHNLAQVSAMTPEARIAVLESQRGADKDVLQDVAGKVDKIATDVQEIKLAMGQQKGFIAGVLFILVPVWGLILAAGAAVYEWWKGQ